jgi:5-(carboxyamino)imidazole ribonucleotide mutase
MGSASDAPTMRHCASLLEELGIPHEMKVCSAHRTPDRAHRYATTAVDRGLKVIVAAAGMSAHLAGVMAALTPLPVLGVPMEGRLMGGLDALLSTCNMPKGVPVATMSMGIHGAVNAALFAAAILGTADLALAARVADYRRRQTQAVPEEAPAE